MNILLVDDHPMFIESVSTLIRRHIPNSEISKAFNGQDAVQMLDRINPTVVILDVNMPGMNGLEVAECINNKSQNIKIIILTNFSGVAMVLSLMKFAHGFLFKESGPAELEECINTVLTGKKYFCERSTKIIVNNADTLERIPTVRFTKRELSIIKLLYKGTTTKQVAATLGIKEKTVNSYREELLRKTKTKNTTELLVYAINNGLIVQREYELN